MMIKPCKKKKKKSHMTVLILRLSKVSKDEDSSPWGNIMETDQ